VTSIASDMLYDIRPADTEARRRSVAVFGAYLEIATQPALFMLPVIVTALPAKFHVGPLEIAQLSFATIGMITASNLIFAPLTRHASWFWVALASCILMLGGNVACALSENTITLLIGCAIASVGNGLLTSIGASAIALSGNPGRYFAVAYFGIATTGVIFFTLSPFFLHLFGWQAIFVAMAAAIAPGFAFLHVLPRRSHKSGAGAHPTADRPEHGRAPRFRFVLALGGQFALYGGLQLMLTYTVAYGLMLHLSADFATYALGGTSLCCVLGSFLSGRLVRLGPALGGSLGAGACLIGLVILLSLPSQSFPQFLFVAGLAGVNFGWNFSLTFLLGRTALMDASGASSAFAMGMVNTGGAVVPFAVVPFIEHADLHVVVAAAALLVGVGGVAVFPLNRLKPTWAPVGPGHTNL